MSAQPKPYSTESMMRLVEKVMEPECGADLIAFSGEYFGECSEKKLCPECGFCKGHCTCEEM